MQKACQGYAHGRTTWSGAVAPVGRDEVMMQQWYQNTGGIDTETEEEKKHRFRKEHQALMKQQMLDERDFGEVPHFSVTDPVHLQDKNISRWLLFSAAVVGAIVMVGGVTRLTESGLSIVKWKPIAGVIPPMTEEEWMTEFKEYQKFPEFKQKPNMTVEEFKMIFFWEWAHRVLARSMGIVFGVPFLYFGLYTKSFKGRGPLLRKLFLALGLGAGQGAMGWYMVKSGLDHGLLERKEKATVSPYRLAAHLTLAFAIYSVLVHTACMIRLPRLSENLLAQPVTRNFVFWARTSLGLMFVTAISGAFVAGLDAGLLYNDIFPWMGTSKPYQVFPSWDHVFPQVVKKPTPEALAAAAAAAADPAGTTAADSSPIELVPARPAWRNMFENPCAAQLWHRLMAGTTTLSVFMMNFTFMEVQKYFGPQEVVIAGLRKKVRFVNHALIGQVLLGMVTIMTYVELPVAVMHQANSLLLLTSLLQLAALLSKKPPM